MLQILRKKAQSTFIQIIVVIIALVFVFWGVGTNLSGNRQAALSVNDVDISFQEYQQAYDQAYQRLSDQFGGNMPRDLADSLNLKQQVINQLVQTALLRQGAAAMGLTVSAEEIRQTIEGMVQFQENGRFDIDRYKEILALNRMAPTIFEESMRHDRLTEVTARAVSSFGAVATDFEIRDIYRRINEKVAVSYVALPSEQFEADVTIDEEALSAWYATAQENYRTEPEVQGKYLVFTYAEIGEKITIDD
ncbi:MAG TPA: SurA N-terminal domain-containing protein [Desulforhopalus sp.]|nr:SurA N-terminal domain-containing protein [Desulforhopalus sp.]